MSRAVLVKKPVPCANVTVVIRHAHSHLVEGLGFRFLGLGFRV
jgi:hypothetical protein